MIPERVLLFAVPTDTVNNSDTLAALSKAMVEGVGKPEQYVLVTVDSGKLQPMHPPFEAHQRNGCQQQS